MYAEKGIIRRVWKYKWETVRENREQHSSTHTHTHARAHNRSSISTQPLSLVFFAPCLTPFFLLFVCFFSPFSLFSPVPVFSHGTDLSHLSLQIDFVFHSVNSYLLSLFTNKYALEQHAWGVKKFVLLAQGDFVQHLLDGIKSVGDSENTHAREQTRGKKRTNKLLLWMLIRLSSPFAFFACSCSFFLSLCFLFSVFPSLCSVELDKPSRELSTPTLLSLLESSKRATTARFEPEEVLARVGVRKILSTGPQNLAPGVVQAGGGLESGWDVFALGYSFADTPLSVIFAAGNSQEMYVSLFNFLLRMSIPGRTHPILTPARRLLARPLVLGFVVPWIGFSSRPPGLKLPRARIEQSWRAWKTREGRGVWESTARGRAYPTPHYTRGRGGEGQKNKQRDKKKQTEPEQAGEEIRDESAQPPKPQSSLTWGIIVRPPMRCCCCCSFF